jgi:ketosteroid isomerase-like protein
MRIDTRAVLERFRQAAINQSADEMRQLYAADAVHEFPFTRPDLPSRLEGRDEIVNWIAGGWKAQALRYERYRTLAIHDTDDPNTIVVEQEAIGSDFVLPNIVVLTTRDGQITHLRDYVNILAAMEAVGGQRDGAPGPHGMPISHHA